MAQIAIAAAVGAVVAIGAYLLAPRPKQPGTEGPRLKESRLTASTEGDPISRLYGRMRVDGEVIWATEFKETANTETTTTQTGGKGGGGGSSSSTTTTYTYSISIAIAFCEGNEKATLSRLWADGKELDASLLTLRFYNGSETQTADSLIEATEGAGNTPAYRGMCYAVFEDLQLESFGNRVPQITAEIVVPHITTDPVDIQNSGKAFTIIPATGETAYGTQQYNQSYETGDSQYTLQQVDKPDNVFNAFRQPNVNVSLDNLYRMQGSNLDAIEIVYSWFGDDLRAGNCRVIPKQEDARRSLTPTDWSVGSYNRLNAEETSKDAEGRPIFGGTPSDATIIELITKVKADGNRAVFYPFILMDIPSTNTLPNPYSDNAAVTGQDVFPWRGRITCSPAPGYAGAVDKTATVQTQIDNFFNGADGYSAFVTHCANICAAAGGVDAFIIGTELRELTFSRSAAGVYPFVTHLKTLAATVSAILPSAKISYAADWSEFVHDVSDGLWFHLDPLWADSNIDFVGIDNYLPLSDWRDGGGHLDYDAVNGPVTEFDIDYLKSQVEGGEYYDYFYATQADRESQTRTPITDATYGKPWVYRRKDYRNWMANQHYNRPGGVEDGSPTAWVANSKPIWFTEFGCPAVNKGTNQPNVFYDPKSSESFFPYFSTGLRDDFVQRVYVETFLEYWDANPIMNGGTPMTDINNMFIWTWDARPFPDFPARSNVWSDGDLWYFGHWLTGRIEAIPLPRLVAILCESAGLTSSQYDVSGLYGPGALVRGFLVDRITTVREILRTLMQGYQFDAFESEGKIKFLLRINTKRVTITDTDYVVTDDDPVGVGLKRGQETELPTSVKVKFVDERNDHQNACVDGKTSKGYSQNVEEIDLPMLLPPSYCKALADSVVQQAWIQRESGTMRLAADMVRLEPGDALAISVGSRSKDVRLTQVNIGEFLDIEFNTFDIGMFTLPSSPESDKVPPIADLFGSVQVEFLDIPLFTGGEALPWSPRIAAQSEPWPGGVDIYRQSSDSSYSFSTKHEFRNAIGRLVSPLYSGPVDKYDRGNTVIVQFDYGAISSTDEITALERAVALGVYNGDGEWEIIQFATATLTATLKYEVTDLIRGALGTEHAMRDPVPANSTVVLLEPSQLSALAVTKDLVVEDIVYRWGPSRYAQTDASYQSGTRQMKMVGLRPYSPVDVFLHRESDGALTVNWKRRTRYQGDSWSGEDIPLNEEFERYRLQIMDGSTVLRTIEQEGSTYEYSAADQATDFGGLQTELKVSVEQYGSDFGGYGIANVGTHGIRSSN